MVVCNRPSNIKCRCSGVYNHIVTLCEMACRFQKPFWCSSEDKHGATSPWPAGRCSVQPQGLAPRGCGKEGMLLCHRDQSPKALDTAPSWPHRRRWTQFAAGGVYMVEWWCRKAMAAMCCSIRRNLLLSAFLLFLLLGPSRAILCLLICHCSLRKEAFLGKFTCMEPVDVSCGVLSQCWKTSSLEGFLFRPLSQTQEHKEIGQCSRMKHRREGVGLFLLMSSKRRDEEGSAEHLTWQRWPSGAGTLADPWAPRQHTGNRWHFRSFLPVLS